VPVVDTRSGPAGPLFTAAASGGADCSGGSGGGHGDGGGPPAAGKKEVRVGVEPDRREKRGEACEGERE
jgi:hypothetical protein